MYGTVQGNIAWWAQLAKLPIRSDKVILKIDRGWKWSRNPTIQGLGTLHRQPPKINPPSGFVSQPINQPIPWEMEFFSRDIIILADRYQRYCRDAGTKKNDWDTEPSRNYQKRKPLIRTSSQELLKFSYLKSTLDKLFEACGATWATKNTWREIMN